MKKLLALSLILGACAPVNTFDSSLKGQIGIRLVWPESRTGYHQNFATQISFDDAIKQGITKMRLRLTDSVKEHHQTVDFNERRIRFTNISEGNLSLILECLNNDEQIIFRGYVSDSYKGETKILSVKVEDMTTVAKTEEISNSLGMKFVKISSGSFKMGSPITEADRSQDELLHQVTLTKPFYMQTTEVTQGQWQEVMGTTLRQQRDKIEPNLPLVGEGVNYPMYYVSWEDAQTFIRHLNQRGEGAYRLPTEAEWEYTARAGSPFPYACGPDPQCLDTMAWLEENSNEMAHPVALKNPNNWGLFDMHGNVLEWVQDMYADYPSGNVNNPLINTGDSSARVIRGAFWSSKAKSDRLASRGYNGPTTKLNFLGFRLVRLF